MDKIAYPGLSNYFKNLHKKRMFSQVSVEGAQGLGKSQYLLKVGMGVYGDWDKVLARTFFALKPAFKLLKDVRGSTRKIPFMIMDDAGAHSSRYAAFQKGGWSLIEAVNSTLDLARESIWGGLGITSPDQDVMKALRSKSWLFTMVGWFENWHGIKLKPDQRVATTYKKKRLPDGKVYPKTFNVDIFEVDVIPSEVLKEYYALKTEASRVVLDKTYEKVSSLEDDVIKQSPLEQARRRVRFLREKDPKEWTWDKIGELEGHDGAWALRLSRRGEENG